MVWALEYDPGAKKELAKLDQAVARSVKKYLDEVCQLVDPASRGHGLTGPMAGQHRYRIGQIRMIVEIQRRVVTILVVKIDRRDSVY